MKGFSMLARLSFAMAAFAFIGAWQVVRASPLTYDFSGTFLDGPGAVMSGPFSGSFTINSDASIGSDGTITETGSDVSMRIGNFLFENNPQNPDTLAWISVADQPNVDKPIVADLEGYMRSIGLSFGMVFYNPGSISQYQDLRNYDFSPSSLRIFELNFQPGGTITSMNYGTVTSIELVSAPEPGTAIAFVVLGAGAMLRQSRRTADRARGRRSTLTPANP